MAQFTLVTLPAGLVSLDGGIWILKLEGLIESAAVLWLTWRCARVRGFDPVLAIIVVGANPLYTLYTLGGSHNDLLMMAFMLAGVALLVSSPASAGREAGGAATIVAGALVMAPLGVMLLSLMGEGVGALLGWGAVRGLVVGMIISVASTMVLSRLLIDSGQLQSTHGKIMIGITLVEDLVVVVLTILMPVLVSLTPHHLLGVGMALGKAALILVPVGFLAVYLVPRGLKVVARSQNQELFLLVILAICLGTAALTEAVGLSLALGGFAAGLIVSASEYAHRGLEQIMTLRDAFVALFFVTVGTLINPRAVLSNPGMLLAILAMVVVGKFVVWTAVVKLFGYRLKTAVLVGTGLTQIGEFSFVLVQVAHANGLVPDEFYYATLAASLLSILLNASLVRSVPKWVGRTAG